MKKVLNQERTKEYWDSYLKKIKNKVLVRTLLFMSRDYIIFFSIICLVFYLMYKDFPWVILIAFLLFELYALLEYCIPFIKEKVKGSEDIIAKSVCFYDMQSITQEGYFADPLNNTYNHFFPAEYKVFKYKLYYKKDGKKYHKGRKKYVFCIGTMEKYSELENLFFMKEPIISRKESRVFDIHYDSVSKELISINLSDGETYPEEYCYSEILEYVNKLF